MVLVIVQNAKNNGGINLIVIGLTGGIASGKSTVSKMLKELGAPIFDADLKAHALLQKTGSAYKEVVNKFVTECGYDILLQDGLIDRKKLGSIVFTNKELLTYLEKVMHKHVEKAMHNFIDKAKKEDIPIVVVDVPLLLEKKWQDKVDKVWVVYVPLDIQKQRLVLRENYTIEEVENRIKSQFPLEEKLEYADFVIDNSGSLDTTKDKVKKAWEQLKKSGS